MNAPRPTPRAADAPGAEAPGTDAPGADASAADAPGADTAGADADVRFFELAGPDARAALDALAAAWRRAGADVELLAAVGQPDLWLLVARGGAEPASPAAPPAARVWRFRKVAP
jgi:hypothetical protein